MAGGRGNASSGKQGVLVCGLGEVACAGRGRAGEDLQRGQKGHGRHTSKETALAIKPNQTSKRKEGPADMLWT